MWLLEIMLLSCGAVGAQRQFAPDPRNFANGNRAVRQGKWKLVWDVEVKRWELYDVQADRTETQDQVAKLPDKVKELAAAYDRWAQSTGHTGEVPPKPKPRPRE